MIIDVPPPVPATICLFEKPCANERKCFIRVRSPWTEPVKFVFWDSRVAPVVFDRRKCKRPGLL